ncbi:MAG: hypothetical protein ABR518_05860 [Actinomycetota bacterium]
MKCDVAQRSLSEAMDEGGALSTEVASHVRRCPSCSRFERGAWRVRSVARFEIAPRVPDLTDAIMASVRAESAAGRRPGAPGRDRTAGDRGPASWVTGPLATAAVVAVLVGFASGLLLTNAAVVERRSISPVLAREIPTRLVGAATALRGYRATFDITELNWTAAVDRRTFRADVEFRAPEAFRVRVADTTPYPSGAWPRNDLTLTTNGRAWRATGPEACPRAALPACPRAAPVDRTVVGRAPFDASTPMPTDVIVPMTVLAASGRVDVAGTDSVVGREAVIVRMTAEDAASLFQYLRFLGSWRPFHPQDRVLLWLDERTWFPLRYEVLPAPGEERAAWATQNVLPPEPADRPVFTATVRTFTTTTPPASAFVVRDAPGSFEQGFRDRSGTTGIADTQPEWLGGLRPWRAGTFAPTATRPHRTTVAAYARGLSWVTVTWVTGWDQAAAFGVGPFAEPITLSGGRPALYEPATITDPRRLSLHTRQGEFLVAGNVPRAVLERVAASLPVDAIRTPEAWRTRRTGGAVVHDGLSPADALGRVGFDPVMPSFLPAGHQAAVASITRATSGTTLTIVFRRPAAELGGIGLAFTQETGVTLAPPMEPGAVAVRVGQSVGRWSPQQHLLEWTDDGRYRSLSSPTLGLATLLQVASSLRPGPEGSP